MIEQATVGDPCAREPDQRMVRKWKTRKEIARQAGTTLRKLCAAMREAGLLEYQAGRLVPTQRAFEERFGRWFLEDAGRQPQLLWRAGRVRDEVRRLVNRLSSEFLEALEASCDAYAEGPEAVKLADRTATEAWRKVRACGGE